MTLTERILSLAARTRGVATSEVPAEREATSVQLWKLTKKGRLFKLALAHGRDRWFTTESMREAYEPTDSDWTPISRRAAKPYALARSRPGREITQPPRGGNMTAEERAKALAEYTGPITLCPSHKPRYQAMALPCDAAIGPQRGRVREVPSWR
jgi:hypothetical protein